MHLDHTILILFSLASVMRLASLLTSIANEKELKKKGAVEYGKRNSKVLILCHTLFYISCLVEAIVLKKQVKDISFLGFGLFIFSMTMLWLVILNLKGMWTVKLFIAPGQTVVKTSIFKYFRHPNYFLNIIPELISIALICQASYTLFIGLPVYLVPLGIRIVQEENIMRIHFPDYY